MNKEMTTLGESCYFFNGKAHEKNIDAEGSFVVVNSRFISTDGRIQKFTGQQKFPLFENDIVMVMSDVPNGKALAKCRIIEENNKYSLNQRICVIRTDEFDIRFLYYQLNRHPYFLAFNNGENQTNLRKGDILNTPLWKPSLELQKKIVTLLDVAFAKIDQAKVNIEKNIANAKELFQSKLNEIFSQQGGGWEEKTLSEISIEFGRGKSKHRPRGDSSLYDGKYPLIQTGDIGNSNHFINNFSKTYNEKGLEQSKLWKKGTICLAIVGANVAETGILNFDSCFPDSVIGIVVDSEKANNEYVEYLLQSFKAFLKEKGKGTARDNINMGTFKKLKFPFPSIEKQITIVKNLNILSENCSELESVFSKKNNEIEDLKKSLLQKAFAGELI